MLNENIKNLRKQKGLSQEELASRLNVVRQTVSKWERGLSVPDADMLEKIAQVLEVSIGDLLGSNIPEGENESQIVQQLIRINEQMALRNRRTKRIIKAAAGIVIGFIVLNIILIVLNIATFQSYETDMRTEVVEITEE